MTHSILNNMLTCPRCKTGFRPVKENFICKKCKFAGKKQDGIWHLRYLSKVRLRTTMEAYEVSHQEAAGQVDDGSYEILASIARGNKTVDIACGQGFLERLAPETVGVDFSINALKKAKKNGAKYLVLADAQALPFKDNSFDVAICSGSLEHFPNPQKAISEMARVSKIQVLTVHREFDFPFARELRALLTLILKVRHQPIEKPFRWEELEEMLKRAKLHIVFKGFWTLPVNFGQVVRFLPVFTNTPSCFLVITVKRKTLKWI